MKLSSLVKEIPITEMQGLRIGNAQDFEAMTGVTVLIFDEGAKVGTDISGGGPASRETPLTSPITADNPINAIVLSGGSAFGLSASDGVMQYLEEHEIGYETGFAKVPLVCQSCIYDLGIGRSDIRPTAKMGYEACENAELNSQRAESSVAEPEQALEKSTEESMQRRRESESVRFRSESFRSVQSLCSMRSETFLIRRPGEKVAGPKLPGIEGFADSREQLYKLSVKTDLFSGKGGNTTIGAIVTNGDFSKAELNKIASMTRCGYARCINPVGTMADGDSIYAASIGKVSADLNMVGTLSAEVMEQAILTAVKESAKN